jgi:hypothetical protein
MTGCRSSEEAETKTLVDNATIFGLKTQTITVVVIDTDTITDSIAYRS